MEVTGGNACVFYTRWTEEVTGSESCMGLSSRPPIDKAGDKYAELFRSSRGKEARQAEPAWQRETGANQQHRENSRSEANGKCDEQ